MDADDEAGAPRTATVQFKGVELTVFEPGEGQAIALATLQRADVPLNRKMRIINQFVDNWMADEASQDAMMGLLTKPAAKALEDIGALLEQVVAHFQEIDGNRAQRRAMKKAVAKKAPAKTVRRR
jgi:hypothetical protein